MENKTLLAKLENISLGEVILVAPGHYNVGDNPRGEGRTLFSARLGIYGGINNILKRENDEISYFQFIFEKCYDLMLLEEESLKISIIGQPLPNTGVTVDQIFCGREEITDFLHKKGKEYFDRFLMEYIEVHRSVKNEDVLAIHNGGNKK